MILLDDLGEGFPTFPQFERMLVDYERAFPLAPLPPRAQQAPTVGVAATVAATVPLSFMNPMVRAVFDGGPRADLIARDEAFQRRMADLLNRR